MIESLQISNFKCIRDLDLSLTSVNMLAGLNGMGKSTCIQSLLLMHQSHREHTPPLGQLVRNGAWTSLGTPQDILWEAAETEEITFGLTFGKTTGPLALQFTLDKQLDEFVNSNQASLSIPTDHGIFTDKLHYLRAERTGPQTSFPTSNSQVRIHHQLGRDGEYAAQFLSEYGENEVVNEAVRHPDASSPQLRHQVEAWLGEISPGTRLYAESHSSLDRVSLHYAFQTGRGETNRYRATNVGFGLSYLLPIITLALGAPQGSLLLIENPEAHIHPHGQMQIGRLLALATSSDLQIILETHSDHILNGLRLAVHEKLITPGDVALHYFERQIEADSNHTTVTSPQIDENGRLDRWPDGFFDQSEKALRKLLIPASHSRKK